jgi:hypothetical protein
MWKATTLESDHMAPEAMTGQDAGGKTTDDTHDLDSTKPGTEDTGPGLIATLVASVADLLRKAGKALGLDSGKEGQADTAPGLADEPESSS